MFVCVCVCARARACACMCVCVCVCVCARARRSGLLKLNYLYFVFCLVSRRATACRRNHRSLRSGGDGGDDESNKDSDEFDNDAANCRDGGDDSLRLLTTRTDDSWKTAEVLELIVKARTSFVSLEQHL